jgi:hypothetical protein
MIGLSMKDVVMWEIDGFLDDELAASVWPELDRE